MMSAGGVKGSPSPVSKAHWPKKEDEDVSLPLPSFRFIFTSKPVLNASVAWKEYICPAWAIGAKLAVGVMWMNPLCREANDWISTLNFSEDELADARASIAVSGLRSGFPCSNLKVP